MLLGVGPEEFQSALSNKHHLMRTRFAPPGTWRSVKPSHGTINDDPRLNNFRCNCVTNARGHSGTLKSWIGRSISLTDCSAAQLSKSEEQARADLSRALSEARQAKNQRDEVLNSLRTIESEQVTHKQQLDTWKAAVSQQSSPPGPVSSIEDVSLPDSHSSYHCIQVDQSDSTVRSSAQAIPFVVLRREV